MSQRDLLIQQVSQDDPELERLVAEHRDLDQHLCRLEAQRWLTSQEQEAIRQMKRHKLQRRDRIEAILDRYR